MSATDYPVLKMAAACDVLAAHLEVTPRFRLPIWRKRESPGRIPATFHQFWDRDPPDQINTLLAHNTAVCAEIGVTHQVWDDTTGRAFLSEHYPEAVAAYDLSPHPAMKSDLLRLALILFEGGVYLDADMAIVPAGAAIWSGRAGGIVFKWTGPERQNAPNWCFGFEPGHRCVAHVFERTHASIVQALQRDPQHALKHILGVSGPGMFTRAVAEYLDAEDAASDVRVLEVNTAYRWLRNGPAILKAPMAYKKTGLHWKNASEETG
ncbi:MAG: hypothetical protein HRU32_02560 [Rhodobacteraceae bacterium]|nr:hypothetical protein [Paracoccaceae bacterium]